MTRPSDEDWSIISSSSDFDEERSTSSKDNDETSHNESYDNDTPQSGMDLSGTVLGGSTLEGSAIPIFPKLQEEPLKSEPSSDTKGSSDLSPDPSSKDPSSKGSDSKDPPSKDPSSKGSVPNIITFYENLSQNTLKLHQSIKHQSDSFYQNVARKKLMLLSGYVQDQDIPTGDVSTRESPDVSTVSTTESQTGDISTRQSLEGDQRDDILCQSRDISPDSPNNSRDIDPSFLSTIRTNVVTSFRQTVQASVGWADTNSEYLFYIMAVALAASLTTFGAYTVLAAKPPPKTFTQALKQDIKKYVDSYSPDMKWLSPGMKRVADSVADSAARVTKTWDLVMYSESKGWFKSTKELRIDRARVAAREYVRAVELKAWGKDVLAWTREVEVKAWGKDVLDRAALLSYGAGAGVWTQGRATVHQLAAAGAIWGQRLQAAGAKLGPGLQAAGAKLGPGLQAASTILVQISSSGTTAARAAAQHLQAAGTAVTAMVQTSSLVSYNLLREISLTTKNLWATSRTSPGPGIVSTWQ